MSDLHSEATATPSATDSGGAGKAHGDHFRWLTPAFFLAILAIGLSVGLAWYSHDRLQTLEVQLARRIGEFDNSSQEARAAAREAQQVLNDMRGRVAAMEGRAQETQNQQLALSAMYQELARGQDERLVADIEQTLLLAQQQLQLAGNVRAAILGLEAVVSRLEGLKKPQFDPLREAITRDVERLRLLPGADVASLNARLEALLQNVDKLKLDVTPEHTAQAATGAAGAQAGSRLERFMRQAWDEVRQLVRIRRMDQPEAPLLAPEQSWFLRQNLKLRLLSARLAAFQRDEATFRADIAAARDWLTRYSNPSDTLVKGMLESLQGLMSVPVAQSEADISESLKALRAYRVGEHG
ncbi:MAG TPA: uroporphyrinogen-III C-methyltransferase [Thiobacillaceae bacterium]|nr:uroporphyrinogen-III C-methyltransferase [Thiobacillaceae bacterium]